jgi:hypothetical protein
MSRNHDPSVRVTRLSQDDVASALVIRLITEFLKRPNDLAARDLGKPRQMATSTSSSAIGGGMGSLCAARLSR